MAAAGEPSWRNSRSDRSTGGRPIGQRDRRQPEPVDRLGQRCRRQTGERPRRPRAARRRTTIRRPGRPPLWPARPGPVWPAMHHVRCGRRRGRTVAAGRGGGPQGAQPVEQLRAAAAAPVQQLERVGVERLGEQVEGGREVLARHRVVGAGAVLAQLVDVGREQRRAGGGEQLLQLGGHVTGEQPGAEERLRRQRLLDAGPERRSGTACSAIAHLVRLRPGALHHGASTTPGRDVEARAPGRRARTSGRGSAGCPARTTPAPPGSAATTRTRRSRPGRCAPCTRPRPGAAGRTSANRPPAGAAHSDHRPGLQGEQVAQLAGGQLGEPLLAGADDLRGQAALVARSSRRSSPPPCRRRRTCGPARCGAGRSGTPGRWPGPPPPGSTTGRRGRRGWPRSGSARCRRP